MTSLSSKYKSYDCSVVVIDFNAFTCVHAYPLCVLEMSMEFDL